MRHSLALPAILLLAACNRGGPAPEEPDPELTPLAEQADTADTVATLEGAWRVAGIDGRPMDGAEGIALEASTAEIWWPPRCARMARIYSIEGKDFTAGALEAEEPACQAELPAGLADVLSALDAGETIERTPANGIRIAGGGRSVTLFSQ